MGIAPQLSYAQKPAVAFAGMAGDNGPIDVESGIAETALDCGLGLVAGTNAGQVKLPGATGDVASFKGVGLYLAQKDPTGAATRFKATEAVPVIKKGRVWVKVDGTAAAVLTAEAPVYLVHSGTYAGTFRSDTGAGGTAATMVAGARCKVAGTAGGIALVDFNIP